MIFDANGGAGGAEAHGAVELPALARRVRALRPSCGRVRLVGVDGHAGSGKSTLAARLSAALGGAPVIHLDDLASHATFFGWQDRLTDDVLRPLAAGGPARYRVYDWERRAFTRTAVVPPAPVVIVEGVGAGRRALRPWLALLVWLAVPEATAHGQGRRRDGPALDAFWDQWTAAERRHFTEDPSKPFADILIVPRDGGYRACA
ncbi:uridine kinase family protein [Streptomyces marincola]|uniref:uridine kinase family protein n=1 Tax=Streptomyces marincola TaxID=2878388 RepID=UPI001CF2205A|nr:hypothetical protein [Streptomyces marincola]UCM86763.1 hypothetical protein LC193_01745 [Streptomyces marincola]